MSSRVPDDPFEDGRVSCTYDRLAERWDEFASTVTPDLRERFVDRLECTLSPGATVVELGCGTGVPVAERLADRCRYLGVDASRGMLSVAARSVPEGKFVLADMDRLQLASAVIDSVVAFYSVIHLPRGRHADLFARIHRWLRPGGWLIATLSGGDLPAGYEEDWLDAGPMHWSGYHPTVAVQLLEAAGFDVLSAEVIPQLEGGDEVQFLWVVGRKP